MSPVPPVPEPFGQLVAEGHPLAITEAPKGTPATALRGIARDDLTAISVVHGPELETPARVAKALLAALGKRENVRGALKNESAETGLVTTWLAAHRTRLVVVTACQHLTTKSLDALINMVTPTAASLVLAVDHRYGHPVIQRARHQAPVAVNWPSALDVKAGDDVALTPVGVAHGSWPLPETGYWTFLADCRRQLLPDTFRQVHTLYLDAYLRVGSWIESAAGQPDALSAEAARDCLRALVEEQPRFDHVQVVARAAQAAFHVHGWYLGIHDRDLRYGLLRFPPIHLDPSVCHALRGLKAPSRAAATALYVAGATVEAIQHVTIDDLAQWRHNPKCRVADVEVPEIAAPYLRAHLIQRLAEGLRPEDAAFSGQGRRVSNDINQAAADLGLNLGEASLTANRGVADKRLPERVLRLERFQVDA